MRRDLVWLVLVTLIALGATASPTTQGAAVGAASAPAAVPPRLAAYKQEVAASVDGMWRSSARRTAEFLPHEQHVDD